MRATDELRRLLDRYGIGHYDHDHSDVRVTEWDNGGKRDARYEEWSSGTVRLDASNVTAGQAIAATMRDEASAHKALIRESDARMALQRDYNNQCERIRNQRKNLKEMQAALERKTCHMTLCAAGNDYARYTCSECERETMAPRVFEGVSRDYEPPKYCANCGRKVVG